MIFISQADSMISRSVDYLRIEENSMPGPDKIVLLVNLIGPQGEMGPEFCGIKYDIKGPSSNAGYRPHEMLHTLVGKSTHDSIFKERIINVVDKARPHFEGSPGAKSYPDPVTYFDECLVRTLDHIIIGGWDNEEERLRSAITLENDYKRGFVLVNDMHKFLKYYEESGKSFSGYFGILLDSLSVHNHR